LFFELNKTIITTSFFYILQNKTHGKTLILTEL